MVFEVTAAVIVGSNEACGCHRYREENKVAGFCYKE